MFGCRWRSGAAIVTVLHHVKLFAGSDLFAPFGTLKRLKSGSELKIQSCLMGITTVYVNMYKPLVQCKSIASTGLLSFRMFLAQSPVSVCLSVCTPAWASPSIITTISSLQPWLFPLITIITISMLLLLLLFWPSHDTFSLHSVVHPIVLPDSIMSSSQWPHPSTNWRSQPCLS